MIDRLEQILSRYAVPLAIVDGGAVASLASCSLDSLATNDVVACIENIDQVRPLLAMPGQAKPEGTKRQKRRWGAVKIQAMARMVIAKHKYLTAIRWRRAATKIQCQARRMAALLIVQAKLAVQRSKDSEVWDGLADVLKANWARAKANAKSNAKVLAMSKAGPGPDLGMEGVEIDMAQLSTVGAGRLEVHLPSLSIDEELRLGLPHYPTDQNLSILGRLCGLVDRNIAHMVVVVPRELPQDVSEYWIKLLELAGVEDAAARLTLLVPERGGDYPTHLPLASLLLYSPIAMRRLTHICGRYKCAYVVPAVCGWQEKLLAVRINTPLLAPAPAAAQLYMSHSGAKRTFDAARVNVAIGAHDIYDQEDLIIALTKVGRWVPVPCRSLPCAPRLWPCP